MGKPAQKQEPISLTRFKRALFFAPIIFWSCANLAGWDNEFRASFSKNSVDQVSSLRSFMQEGHATSGGTGHTQHDTHQSPRHKTARQAYKTAQDLLTEYSIDTNLFLSLQNIPSRNIYAHLQAKSYDDLNEIKQSLTQFFKKFETDKRFRKQVSKIKQVGIYRAIKVGKKKRWKSRKQITALRNYANHVYQAVCNTLKKASDSVENLCQNFLQTNIGKTAQYFLGRFMFGVRQAGIDIQATLSREKRDGPCDFARDLLQKAKTQPIRETLGDVTQLLSRTTINATAVFVAVSAIAVTIETGVAAATAALGAVAAQKLFEPLALSINLDGSVAVEAAASSGVSIWQAIAASVAPAVQVFTGVVEQAGHLFYAMESNGGGANRGGNPINICPSTDSFEEISLYIDKKGKLPDSYITKEKAKSLGWVPRKGNLNVVAPGKSIGGNVFENKANASGVKLLPDSPGRIWYEADVGYKAGYRGIRRVLYSNDGLIYKTLDHYRTAVRIK